MAKLETQTHLKQESDKIGDTNTGDKSETTRRRSLQRLSGEFEISSTKCFICGQLQNGGNRELKTIGPFKSQKLFDASRLFQDDVWTKMATLESAEAITLAYLQAHRTCFRKYKPKYERSIQEDESSSRISPKKRRNDSGDRNNSQDFNVVNNDDVTNTIKGLMPR